MPIKHLQCIIILPDHTSQKGLPRTDNPDESTLLYCLDQLVALKISRKWNSALKIIQIVQHKILFAKFTDFINKEYTF